MEVASVREIEGLAMIGRVVEAGSESLGRNRFRLCVKLVDGKELCTPPLNDKHLELVKRCVELYTRLKLVR